MLARFGAGAALASVGKHSIVIYLTFFIPMKLAQKGFAMTGLVPDVGTASFLVMAAGIGLPLLFHWMIKRTPLIALYERPGWARLKPAKVRRAGVGLLER